MTNDIQTWEGEGGSPRTPVSVSVASMHGTTSQVEWAVRIRRQVNDEFDRVARSFRTVAKKQSEARRADTEAILAILEDKRTAVMSTEEAGYFIHDWQEINGQVRELIGGDSRFQAIKAKHAAAPAVTQKCDSIRPEGHGLQIQERLDT